MSAVRALQGGLLIIVLTMTGCSPTESREIKNDSVANATLEITPAATSKIRELAEHGGFGADFALRVGVKGGGCTGFNHYLSLDSRELGPQESCELVAGILVIYKEEHKVFLQGARIDWIADENGFQITYPNQTEENKAKVSKWVQDNVDASQSDYEAREREADPSSSTEPEPTSETPANAER